MSTTALSNVAPRARSATLLDTFEARRDAPLTRAATASEPARLLVASIPTPPSSTRRMWSSED
jgi:hypothetical protein